MKLILIIIISSAILIPTDMAGPERFKVSIGYVVGCLAMLGLLKL